MSKFRVGDKVVRVGSVATDSVIKVGGVYTIKSIKNGGEIALAEAPGGCYLGDHFKLAKRRSKDDEWSFTVSSDKLISLSEIYNTLTRGHPMAIVYKGDLSPAPVYIRQSTGAWWRLYEEPCYDCTFQVHELA